MGRGKKIQYYEQELILQMHKMGFDEKIIASLLNRSVHVVLSFLKDPSAYNRKNPGGRPSKLTIRDVHEIWKLAGSGKMSATNIKQELKIDVTTRQVQHIIKSIGNLVWSLQKKAPKMKSDHKVNCVKFAYDSICN